MTRLSVNINKIALIRNARGGNLPDLYQVAKDCERFGAQGITVHPRPDERHIRYADLEPLKELVTTEFNIEGYPSERFMQKVKEVRPHQCTLVPDPPGVLTSDSGWDTIKEQETLKRVVGELKNAGIRVSIFLDAEERLLEGARSCGADRIELYTGDFAKAYEQGKTEEAKLHHNVARIATEMGLGVNAGHDLNLDNLAYYNQEVKDLLEVSIGHALVSDALYFGLYNTIQLYLRELKD